MYWRCHFFLHGLFSLSASKVEVALYKYVGDLVKTQIFPNLAQKDLLKREDKLRLHSSAEAEKLHLYVSLLKW